MPMQPQDMYQPGYRVDAIANHSRLEQAPMTAMTRSSATYNIDGYHINAQRL